MQENCVFFFPRSHSPMFIVEWVCMSAAQVKVSAAFSWAKFVPRNASKKKKKKFSMKSQGCRQNEAPELMLFIIPSYY